MITIIAASAACAARADKSRDAHAAKAKRFRFAAFPPVTR